MPRTALIIPSLLLLTIGCVESDPPVPGDSGTVATDSGPDTGDSGTVATDSGPDTGDSGNTPRDRDGDGRLAGEADCDDNDPEVYQGADELCDGKDNDCDGDIDADEGCPCDLVRRQNETYLFCESKLNWVAAENTCALYGYELVSIEDDDENAWIDGQREERLTEGGETLGRSWIGLSDRAEEGLFVWIDGREPTYVNWSGDEPNNASGNEDCGGMWDKGTGQWNDFNCDDEKPFICQLGQEE